jgi:addiction module RelE/StbE family toxin
MEVRWSPRAAEDLERIFKHIEQDNPTAARQVVKTIYERCAALREFPHLGRPGRMPGRRELVFAPLPYIAVYQVKKYAVEISRIYHGAQDWP